MKIYSKSDFLMGIFCLGAIPLFAFNIISVDWWQYFITLAISASFLYRGLSEKASIKNNIISTNFKATALKIYGRFYIIKTNLPWIMILAFYPIALVLRFVFRIWLPIWIHLIFVVGLTMAVFYSIGIIKSVKADIEKNVIKNDNDANESNL